jgi:hypothetical protein
MCESVNVCVYRKFASPYNAQNCPKKNILHFELSYFRSENFYNVYTRLRYYGYNIILKLMIVGCMYEEMRSCREFVITLECTIETLFSSKI